MHIFENSLALAGYPLRRASRDLGQIQKMSKDLFSHWQEKKRWEIVNYHYKYNAFYRKMVNGPVPLKWADLPVLTKKDFQQKLVLLISNEFKVENLYIGSTSGSSGCPLSYAVDKYAHALTWAVIKHRYSLYGLSLGSSEARFYGMPLEKIGFIKEILKDKLSNRIRFSVFDLSDAALLEFYKKFKKHNFIYVYGYAASIAVFAKYLIKNSICLKDICPTIKLCIVTSETCTPEDRKIIESAFGVPVINEYGASEFGIIAFEFPSEGWSLSEETVYVEVIDAEGRQLPYGEEGEILVTSLFNKAMPMIRYKLGDIGSIGEAFESSFRRNLKDLSGRVHDTVKLPSGKISSSWAFYYVSKSVLEASGVKEFIVKQVELNKFIFEIIAEKELKKSVLDELKTKMNIYLEPGLILEIKKVNSIQRPSSGKAKHFYSLLDKHA